MAQLSCTDKSDIPSTAAAVKKIFSHFEVDSVPRLGRNLKERFIEESVHCCK